MNAHTSFAETSRLRQKIIEVIMRDGISNSQALDIVVRLYDAGFKIIPIKDQLMRAIAEHGQIPHMTQR